VKSTPGVGLVLIQKNKNKLFHLQNPHYLSDEDVSAVKKQARVMNFVNKNEDVSKQISKKLENKLVLKFYPES
jgi:hypothetical protein